MGSTKPCAASRRMAAARNRLSSSVARNRQLRFVPGRRPVRPMRCETRQPWPARINLDDAVEVADIQSQVFSAGGTMTQLSPSAKSPLRLLALLQAQRAVRHVRCHMLARSFSARFSTRERLSQKTSRFFTAMKSCNHRRGVIDIADVVKHHIGRRGSASTGDATTLRSPSRCPASQLRSSSGFPTVCRQTDALKLAPAKWLQTFERGGQQVPAPIIPAKACSSSR